MKRARANSGGSVTGGTGDIKPQTITLNTGFTGGGISQYAVQRIVLPVLLALELVKTLQLLWNFFLSIGMLI